MQKNYPHSGLRVASSTPTGPVTSSTGPRPPSSLIGGPGGAGQSGGAGKHTSLSLRESTRRRSSEGRAAAKEAAAPAGASEACRPSSLLVARPPAAAAGPTTCFRRRHGAGGVRDPRGMWRVRGASPQESGSRS